MPDGILIITDREGHQQIVTDQDEIEAILSEVESDEPIYIPVDLLTGTNAAQTNNKPKTDD